MSDDQHFHFKGNSDRNEVNVDLTKFMSMMQENFDLREQLREAEMDERKNPWIKFIHFARMIDAWRIFPRIFITTYIYLVYATTTWFMALPDPSNSQMGLISVVVGAGAAWFGLYVNSGPWKRPVIKKDETSEE